MEQELKSEGKCLFCNDMVSQKAMTKHLDLHLAKMEKEGGKTPQSYHHLRVECDPFFLNLLVKSKSEMEVIDDFLKDIWLECCGHLSDFRHKDFEIDMDDTVESIFTPNIKIWHDYDFGSTTTVQLTGGKQYLLSLKESIVLLSRNEPLKLLCATCKKLPAVYICSVCKYDQYAYFCKTCSKKHAKECEDFEDYAKMPVVNSPRMGECAYEGGMIDKKRDGIWTDRT